MPNTRNTRVATLLKSLGLDVMEASARIRKQPTTLYRIVNNENEASKSTLKILAEALGANYEWLLTGKGEMLDPSPKDPAPAQSMSFEKALADLQAFFQDQIRKKDEQIADLAAILKKVNFLEPLTESSRGNSRTLRAAA